ncbi:MAG: hypothetical protein PHS86_15110 [Syntrophaceae bacterium]|nr:hypothetical protein [Syntrophaceae bacterium]
MKEKINHPSFKRKDIATQTFQEYWDKAKTRVLNIDEPSRSVGVSFTVEQYLRQRERISSRRKWAGRGLSLLGSLTLLGSCAVSMFSTTGLYSASLGLGLLISGLALSSWKPRLKESTEALIAAHKYGNVLNTARLALELDVSPQKAESILQELVRNGIAEIDLDHESSDGELNYRIKGL